VVTPAFLLERRVIRDVKDGLKVLGDGELNRPLTVHAHKFSKSAVEKIGQAGGSTVVLEADDLGEVGSAGGAGAVAPASGAVAASDEAAAGPTTAAGNVGPTAGPQPEVT